MTNLTNFKSLPLGYENLTQQRRQVAQSKDKIIHFLLSNLYLKDKVFSDFLFFSRDAYEHELEKIVECSNRNVSVVTIDASIDSHLPDTFSVEISVATARHISKRASDQNYLKLFFTKDRGVIGIDKKAISFSGGDGEAYKNNNEKMSIHETVTHKKMCLSFIDMAVSEVDKEQFISLVCDMISTIKWGK